MQLNLTRSLFQYKLKKPIKELNHIMLQILGKGTSKSLFNIAGRRGTDVPK